MLLEHLRLNSAANVAAFNCAVAKETGLVEFYENALDLMKGSTDPEGAAAYEGRAAEPTIVLGVSGGDVSRLVEPFERLLVKVDVVGAEADVLETLSPLIDLKRPDILTGVWWQNAARLSQLRSLKGYGTGCPESTGTARWRKIDSTTTCPATTFWSLSPPQRRQFASAPDPARAS